MDVAAIAENYRDIITNHYFDMRGRVGRSQFWWFVLANIIASMLAHFVGSALHLPLGELYNLAVLLPAMSLGARRLQDIGRNGQLVWALLLLTAVTQVIGIFMALAWFFTGFFAIVFAPGLTLAGILMLIVAVVLIWFWCQPGDAGPNAYGPVPPRFDPSKPVTPAP
jgi:uncharacterized membrane protein YhaH (DUF805 family)